MENQYKSLTNRTKEIVAYKCKLTENDIINNQQKL